MALRVTLRLVGLDLRDPDSYERIPDGLAEYGMGADGPVSYLTVFTTPATYLADTLTAARAVAVGMPGVQAANIYDELVTTSDIAHRCAVSAEGVRLWVSGTRRTRKLTFPAARDSVGAHSKQTLVWAWRDVLAWVRDVLGLDPEDGTELLTDRQVAELNYHLALAAEQAAEQAAAADGGAVKMSPQDAAAVRELQEHFASEHGGWFHADTLAEAVAAHEHDHTTPCGIRNHPIESRFADPAKVAQVRAEIEEMG